MTRALTAAAPVDPPAGAPPAPPRPRRRSPGRPTVCAVLTLAALAVAVAGPAAGRREVVLALCAVVVGWGGWPLHRAAWRALHLGGCADVLPTAGVLATYAAACVAPATGGALPLTVPAAVTTILLAGRAATTGMRRRVDLPMDAVVPDEAIDEATARADRDAVAVERVADRATGGVACLVAVLAVATLGFWAGAGAGAAASLGATAAVLLSACPRMVGSTAATVVRAATRRAVALHAVPANPRVLELAARVDAVVLCRTGTVTRGVRQLQAVHVAEGVDPEEALRLAGAVTAAAQEAGGPAGSHPVGAVVAQAARDRFATLPGVAEFDGYPGLGVRGVVSELRPGPDTEPRVIAHATLVGRVALLAEHGIGLPPELADAVDQVHAAGTSAVAVSWDGVARAVLEVVDPVRPESVEVVRHLHRLGIVPLLLTGDDAGVARGTAEALAMNPEQVLAEVTADARAAAVTALRAQGRTVAVLGGPDDAAALAAADLAMVRPRAAAESPGTTGRVPRPDSGAAVDGVPTPHPDHVLMLRDDDPLVAIDVLRLARRTVRTVERTLTAAVAVHLLALPAAAAGVLPPLAAAAAAALASLATARRAAAVRRLGAVRRPTAN
jgi:P-type Cu+ transporter